jgi:trimeric autotransporter adhesin
MTDLTGKLIANSYKDLLTINSSATNEGVDGTLRRVQDGSGNNTALELSQSSAKVNGTMGVTGSMSVAGGLAVGSLTIDGLSVSALDVVDLSATNINTTNITVNGDGVATSAALTSVEAIISSNIVFVLNAQASVLGVLASLAAVDTGLQSNINQVSAVAAQNTVQTSINAVQIGLAQTSIAANSSAISVNTTNIASNTSAININTTNIAANTSAIAINTSLIALVNASVIAANTSSIAVNASAINVVSAALVSTSGVLTTNINTVSAGLSIANVSIAANSSAIVVNSAAITSINGVIGTLASAGTSATLETRIAAVSSTMATSIANSNSAITALSATLESRIATVSSTMATSISNSNSVISALSATMATSIANHLRLSGGTMTGNLILNADPSANLQAASKQYVDNLTASSIHIHEAVRVETNGTNLNATYNNGSSGVGATLTNAGTQAALAIDGVTLNTSDRVLVMGQTNQTQNGVYVVTNTGSGSTNWILTRSDDTDTSGDGDANTLDEGSYFFVQEGTIGAAHAFVCNTQGTIVFGTTNITFAQFSDSVEYTAGTGININESRVISTSGVPTNAELAAVSATLATSIANVSATLEGRIATVSSTMATSIANSNSAIAAVSVLTQTNLDAISSVNAIAIAAASAGTSATLETRIATVSSTMATSIGNSNSAITALSATMATSIGNSNAAITSINNVAYLKNTALSATTGTFTGIVSVSQLVAASAVIGTPSQWKIYVSSNNLKFSYGGVTKIRVNTLGALQVSDDLEAFTTLS